MNLKSGGGLKEDGKASRIIRVYGQGWRIGDYS
jgi:hypothetical protein